MAHDCVTKVCATILEMEGEYVVWPSEEQQRQEEAKFFGMYGEFAMVTAIESLLSSLFTDLVMELSAHPALNTPNTVVM